MRLNHEKLEKCSKAELIAEVRRQAEVIAALVKQVRELSPGVVPR